MIEFLPVRIEGEPLCLEHSALVWAGEEEMLALALAPSDLQFARFLAGLSARPAGE